MRVDDFAAQALYHIQKKTKEIIIADQLLVHFGVFMRNISPNFVFKKTRENLK